MAEPMSIDAKVKAILDDFGNIVFIGEAIPKRVLIADKNGKDKTVYKFESLDGIINTVHKDV